jgi:hypothetical protein
MGTGGTNPRVTGAVMFTALGTKLCLRCHQRKTVKGGKQSSDGRKFICCGCRAAKGVVGG